MEGEEEEGEEVGPSGVPPCVPEGTRSRVRKWLISWERVALRESYCGVLMCSILVEQRANRLMVSVLVRTSGGNFLRIGQ